MIDQELEACHINKLEVRLELLLLPGILKSTNDSEFLKMQYLRDHFYVVIVLTLGKLN